MKTRRATTSPEVARFRTRLLVAMMLVIAAITTAGLALARRNVAADEERSRQREFRAALATLHNVQQLRHTALVERSRALARRARIHAALEDGALDLLYPSANDELRDVLVNRRDSAEAQEVSTLRARFYRFLDAQGAVISPLSDEVAGALQADEEAQLALPEAPVRPQIGYLSNRASGAVDETGAAVPAVTELIATPIISNETGEVLAALVLGFPAIQLRGERPETGLRSGIWLEGRLHLPSLGETARAAVLRDVTRALVRGGGGEGSFYTQLDAEPHLLFYKQLNPDSLFAPAYEVCVFPLAEML
ncbi:MAG TPA: hypothetical protein VGD81_01430, partial [Opitutaceae bacterium]